MRGAILSDVPGRKDGRPNKPGQGAPKKPAEAKRNRWVLYVTDADRARIEEFAKTAEIDLRKREKPQPTPTPPIEEQQEGFEKK